MHVNQIMQQSVITCEAWQTAQQAAAQMWHHHVGALVVMNGGEVVGMITDRDIAMACLVYNRRPTEVPVHEAMSKRLYRCHPDDTIADAERTMREHKVRRLPVLDGDQLVGIVTISDLAHASETFSRRVPAKGVVHTLGAIALRRTVAEA